jgi:hypothetical protein
MQKARACANRSVMTFATPPVRLLPILLKGPQTGIASELLDYSNIGKSVLNNHLCRVSSLEIYVRPAKTAGLSLKADESHLLTGENQSHAKDLPLKQTEISSCQLIAIASSEQAAIQQTGCWSRPMLNKQTNKQNTPFRFMAHQQVVPLS